MRHPRIIIASIGLAAAAIIGGGTAAAVAGSPASSAPPAASAPPASTGPSAGQAGAAAATVRIAHVLVGGKTAAILVNAQGLPLYYYAPDTATKSLVSGALAALWPPLTSAAPTAAGVSGKLTVIHDAHGGQVAYNGHLLYTFADDQPGQVTGQGVQNFFVATPGLAPITASSTPTGTVPASPSSGGYGY
jgi:predicted lipoprotein with Yx(FWY)xxD motif